MRAVADRLRAVEADPTVANGGAELLGTAHPQITLLLAGERGALAVLAERARTYGDGRVLGDVELLVAAREVRAQRFTQRCGPNQRRDPRRGLLSGARVGDRQAGELRFDRRSELRIRDEVEKRFGRQREPGRDRDARGDQLAEPGALAAVCGGV